MGRRRTTRAVARRGPKNQVWAVSVFEQTNVPVATTALLAVLVAGSDWNSSNSSAERATLLRIRGWMSMRQETAAGVGTAGAIFLGIFVLDEDGTTPDMSTASTYADEDILWTGGVQLPSLGDATARSFTMDWIVDVKSMRRITNGQGIRLAVTNPTGSTCDFSGVFRSLVRKSG